MKKTLLALLMSLFAGSLLLGQSLALSWDGVDIHDGDSIYVYGEISDDMWYEIQAHAVVTNMADDQVEVKVKRNIIDTVPGTRNQFCWVLCYGFDVNDSFYSVELDPGESSSNSEFSGHYQPLGKSGTSIIEYIFYNVDNEDDQVSMKVFYTIHTPSASLELSWDGENIPNGDTVYVYGEISEDMWYEIQAHAIVTNVSEDTVEVKVHRIIIDTVPGTRNQFCWVLCYAYETNESSYSVTLDPGASTSELEFSGHYQPAGNGGTSKIRYKFFNVDNEQDTVSMTVFYVVSPASVADLQSASHFGSAYPNPASEIVSFDFEFSHTVKEARLVIYNLLGKQVMDYPVNNRNGKLSVPLHELNEGVYFYTFMVNGETAATTRKLVVQR